MSTLDVRSIDVKQLRKQRCPSAAQEFRIFVAEAAFDRAVARGDSDTTREIGGVLVGEVLADDAGPYLRIDATVDALHADEKGAELTFTHATWEHIHKEMDTHFQDKRVVGWYHTHPGFGVFLSDRDQFIHRSFFNLPFQVALVYDPKSREHGVFVWHDDEVRRVRRYWIGAREQTWDGPRLPAPPNPRERAELETHKPPTAGSVEREVDHAARSSGELGQGAWVQLLAAGLVLVLIGGFFGRWLGVTSANEALADAQIAIAGAKADGAKAGVAMLQSDLLGLLRDTYGDEAARRPVTEAIAVIDQLLAALPAQAEARPVVFGPMPLGASGSAASDPPGDARWAGFAQELKTARARLVQLDQARGTAYAQLKQLEARARRGSDLPVELVRELAAQRAGLGAIYAELAADAAKADPARARRLLAAAAHLDPGNRVRYEKQLQTFDPKGQLPGAAKVGASSEGDCR